MPTRVDAVAMSMLSWLLLPPGFLPRRRKNVCAGFVCYMSVDSVERLVWKDEHKSQGKHDPSHTYFGLESPSAHNLHADGPDVVASRLVSCFQVL